MQPFNRWAFKEWAVVCEALAGGRQSLILRKGGIHEGREGFRVEHPEFWLFPTRFHQEADELIDEAGPLLDAVRNNPPPTGMIGIARYSVVEEVVRIEDERALPQLTGLHIWSEGTLDERFHYRTPGLFALVVRVYALREQVLLPDSPHFAGCRSWVDLPDDLPTAGLFPVIDDTTHRCTVEQIRKSLGERRYV